MTAPVAYVVDTSVAVKLYVAEPLAAEAAALFGLLADPAHVLHVPDLFYAERANIFWKHVRRGGASTPQVTGHLADLTALPLHRVPTFDLAGDALDLALTHGITAYDACYAALSRRLGVPLITADQRLERALAGAGLAVVWLGNWAPPGQTTPAVTTP